MSREKAAIVDRQAAVAGEEAAGVAGMAGVAGVVEEGEDRQVGDHRPGEGAGLLGNRRTDRSGDRDLRNSEIVASKQQIVMTNLC